MITVHHHSISTSSSYVTQPDYVRVILDVDTLKSINEGVKRLSIGFPWETLIYVDVNFEIESPQEDELQGTALKISNLGFLSLVIYFRFTDDTITVDLGRITDHL